MSLVWTDAQTSNCLSSIFPLKFLAFCPLFVVYWKVDSKMSQINCSLHFFRLWGTCMKLDALVWVSTVDDRVSISFILSFSLLDCPVLRQYLPSNSLSSFSLFLSISISLTWHVGQFTILLFVYLPFAIAATIDCFPLGALHESNHYTFPLCTLHYSQAGSIGGLTFGALYLLFSTHICYAPVDRLPCWECLACQWRERLFGEIDAHRHTAHWMRPGD